MNTQIRSKESHPAPVVPKIPAGSFDPELFTFFIPPDSATKDNPISSDQFINYQKDIAEKQLLGEIKDILVQEDTVRVIYSAGSGGCCGGHGSSGSEASVSGNEAHGNCPRCGAHVCVPLYYSSSCSSCRVRLRYDYVSRRII